MCIRAVLLLLFACSPLLVSYSSFAEEQGGTIQPPQAPAQVTVRSFGEQAGKALGFVSTLLGQALANREDSAGRPPYDPCLPEAYGNWREFGVVEGSLAEPRSAARIIIDRDNFRLYLERVLPDGSAEVVYQTEVALGQEETPTPEGQFLINHVYCYPDVLFFTPEHEKVATLYAGFMAPLLACDENGNCRRYRELAIHGFNAAAHPDSRHIRPETVGPVSNGCVRLPDPCAFKRHLIRLAGVGPPGRDERGSYHWLSTPVDVWVVSNQSTAGSLVEQGLRRIGRGLESLLGVFSR